MDRGRLGSKHHLLVDARGAPLAATLTGANRNDITQLLPLLDAIPPVRDLTGRPRRRPAIVQGDRGYDGEEKRRAIRRRGMRPLLAERRSEHGSGLGVYRWVIERSIAWLHEFRRLRVRFERRADIHEAFMKVACILICWRLLNQ